MLKSTRKLVKIGNLANIERPWERQKLKMQMPTLVDTRSDVSLGIALCTSSQLQSGILPAILKWPPNLSTWMGSKLYRPSPSCAPYICTVQGSSPDWPVFSPGTWVVFTPSNVSGNELYTAMDDGISPQKKCHIQIPYLWYIYIYILYTWKWWWTRGAQFSDKPDLWVTFLGLVPLSSHDQWSASGRCSKKTSGWYLDTIPLCRATCVYKYYVYTYIT
jgi:hypothetical protein